MNWLVAILTALLKALLPWAAKQTRPTAQDSDPDPALQKKLREKVRRHWMVIAIGLAILSGGCGVRTVYVPHGVPVRLRQSIKNVDVWVKDSGGETVAGKMDLPEGWYCLPVDTEE